MSGALEGKRIIVTGGAQGMGAATVRAYVREGAHVALLDVNEELGAAVAISVTGTGTARFIPADISKRASVDDAFLTAVDLLGGLDVLANVAGVQRRMPASEFRDDDLDFLIRVNLLGTILTNQAAFEHLKERGGRIINLGSDGGLVAMRGVAAYAATKGGVHSWTRAIALEWSDHGIRANSVVPAMQTPMTNQGGADGQAVYSTVPLGGRLGDPDLDFAPVMVFMAGEGSRFITGQLISVNGGLAMTR